MKNVFIVCTYLLLGVGSVSSQTVNLIQNGNFETFDATTCCNTNPANCSAQSTTVSNAFNTNCLSSTGWYSSHGSNGIAQNECIVIGPAIASRTCISNNAQLEINSGIYYDNNLSLLSNTVYTLTIYVWSAKSSNAQSAYIKLANGLSSGSGSTIQNVQNQTIYYNNFTNSSPQKIVIDFVPNDTYHQVWFYLTNAGSFNIDEIDLRVKETYSGLDLSTTPCCGNPVIYTNSMLPVNTTGNESITGNNVTCTSTSNTVLQAGAFIHFTQGTHLTSSTGNYVSASITSCKSKPFSSGAFGAGPNILFNNCETILTEIGSTNIQKDVTYSWTSSPSNALQYIGNLVGSKAYVIPPIPDNTSIVYTLNASNSCGSSQSSMTYTHTGTCSNTSRLGSMDIESEDGNSISIYPNPTNGAFVLTLNASEKNTTTCTIYNNTGEEVYSKSYGKLQVLNQDIELNVQSGLYLVKLKHGDNVYEQKILITK